MTSYRNSSVFRSLSRIGCESARRLFVSLGLDAADDFAHLLIEVFRECSCCVPKRVFAVYLEQIRSVGDTSVEIGAKSVLAFAVGLSLVRRELGAIEDIQSLDGFDVPQPGSSAQRHPGLKDSQSRPTLKGSHKRCHQKKAPCKQVCTTCLQLWNPVGVQNMKINSLLPGWRDTKRC